MLQVPLHYARWYRPLEAEYLSRRLQQHFGYDLLLLGNSDLEQVKDSPVSNHYALREQERLSFEGVVAHFDALPFAPDSLDVIVLAHALDHCEEPRVVLEEAYKALRHDGTLIVTGFNRWRALSQALWRYEARQYLSLIHI